jgi:hypothetical protein
MTTPTTTPTHPLTLEETFQRWVDKYETLKLIYELWATSPFSSREKLTRDEQRHLLFIAFSTGCDYRDCTDGTPEKDIESWRGSNNYDSMFYQLSLQQSKTFMPLVEAAFHQGWNAMDQARRYH